MPFNFLISQEKDKTAFGHLPQKKSAFSDFQSIPPPPPSNKSGDWFLKDIWVI